MFIISEEKKRKKEIALFEYLLHTDSGRFRYDGTTSETFARASYLMKYNIDISDIYRKLYTVSKKDLNLKSYFASKAQFTENNVGYIYITKQELENLNISAFDASRGYVNTLSDIENVHIWAAFAESDYGILCELRSSIYNINPIAVKYGGGGHSKACGATVSDKSIVMNIIKDLNTMAVNYGQQKH